MADDNNRLYNGVSCKQRNRKASLQWSPRRVNITLAFQLVFAVLGGALDQR